MKNKVAAGVLALVAGSFGIHRFYLGDIGKGILHLVLFWTSIPFFIGLVDGIIFLTMDDEKFDRKYNPELYYGNQSTTPTNDQRRQRRDEERNMHRNQGQERRTPNNMQDFRKKRGLKAVRKTNRFKAEGTVLYRDYDFQGAIEAYKKSLKVEPDDPQIHFNMACLYSLMEDTQSAYMHLSTAINQGYVDYDKIKAHNHLAYLRTHAEYEQFVRNGYSFKASLAAPQEPILELTDDVIVRLERLSQLKDKGILTDEEFQKQKKIILRRL